MDCGFVRSDSFRMKILKRKFRERNEIQGPSECWMLDWIGLDYPRLDRGPTFRTRNVLKSRIWIKWMTRIRICFSKSWMKNMDLQKNTYIETAPSHSHSFIVMLQYAFHVHY